MSSSLLLALSLVVAAAGLPLYSAVPGEFDHSEWDAIVRAHVNRAGEVDYAAIKANRAALDRYIEALAAASPDSHGARFPQRSDQLAYWINAYNALVTRGVVDAYPTRSVRDLGLRFGFFKRPAYVLGGRKLSLQILENEIIRGRYKDPRVHFAIVCASVSCPRLAREAYAGAKLEEQLDGAVRASLAEPRMVSIDPGAKTLRLTSLFKWYAADFGPVPAFLRRYLSPERGRELEALGANPRVGFADYDWSINDPGSRAKARQPEERALARLP